MAPLPIRLSSRILSTEETRRLSEQHQTVWPAYNLKSTTLQIELDDLCRNIYPNLAASFIRKWLAHPDERFVLDLLPKLAYGRPVPSPYLAWLIEAGHLSAIQVTSRASQQDPAFWDFSARLWPALTDYALAELDKSSLLVTPLLDALLLLAEKSWHLLQTAQVYPKDNSPLTRPPSFDPRFEPYLDKLAKAIQNTSDLESSALLATAHSATLSTLLAKHTTILGEPALAVAMVQNLSPALFQEIFNNPSLSQSSQEMFQEWLIIQMSRAVVSPRVRAISKALDLANIHFSPSQRLRLNMLLHEPSVTKATLDALAQIPDLVRDKDANALLMYRAPAERRYLIMESSRGPAWLSLALQGLKETTRNPGGTKGQLYQNSLKTTTAENLSGLSRQDLLPWIESKHQEYRLMGIRLATWVPSGSKTRPTKPKVVKPRRRPV